MSLDPPAGPGDLDSRRFPPEVRHDRMVGAVLALTPGEQIVIAADQDPGHLREVLVEELGAVDWTYLQSGPDLWRVRVGPGAH